MDEISDSSLNSMWKRGKRRGEVIRSGNEKSTQREQYQLANRLCNKISGDYEATLIVHSLGAASQSPP